MQEGLVKKKVLGCITGCISDELKNLFWSWSQINDHCECEGASVPFFTREVTVIHSIIIIDQIE